MPRDEIKRLRGLVNGAGGLGAIEIDEVRALLDIAEAALLYMTDHSEDTGEALIAVLAKLEAQDAP